MLLFPINHVLRRIDQALATVLCAKVVSCRQDCDHNPVRVSFTTDSMWHEEMKQIVISLACSQKIGQEPNHRILPTRSREHIDKLKFIVLFNL